MTPQNFVTLPREVVGQAFEALDTYAAQGFRDNCRDRLRAALTEQVQPAQGEPDVCCTQYETCLKPCTPRGRELALKEAALLQSNAERVPLSDARIQAIWDIAAGSLPGWSRHIAYARAIEAEITKGQQ